jgi:hypothetical protein
MIPPVDPCRVPDLGSIDDGSELLLPLHDRGHGSTDVMDAPGDRSIAELVESVPGRDEDARHLLMVSPQREEDP